VKINRGWIRLRKRWTNHPLKTHASSDRLLISTTNGRELTRMIVYYFAFIRVHSRLKRILLWNLARFLG
jgi:hypothetical protein